MRREEVRKGVCVRLLSDWVTVPKDTTGVVDKFGTEWSGQFYFTVLWDTYLPLPLYDHPKIQRPKVMYAGPACNTELREEGLDRFVVITEEERHAAVLAFVDPDARRRKAELLPIPPREIEQQSLPFGEMR
jgi:hypothetical protein